MQNIIELHGGNCIYETGTLLDTILFFDSLNYFVADRNADQDWSILTDRLYRRYIRLEELELAANKMREVEQIFSEIPCSEIDWTLSSTEEKTLTWLDPKSASLADMFYRYFSNFKRAKDSANWFLHHYEIYKPVKIISGNIGGWVAEHQRSLEEYETLNGEPFWRY